mmetsp:Transcript_7787/g.12460  ORF Transcript_7787/g.12460 Transcript_7787/m.12460 type:complete len:163 (-) Transcript_7787:387-875(-)
MEDSIRKSNQWKFGVFVIDPSEIFFFSGSSVGLVNLKPVVPGHVLVCSKRIVARFKDLTDSEISDLWISARKIAVVIEKVYHADSVTYAIQDGPSAGQTVSHVHIHILPRKTGDFTKKDEIYDRIEEHEKSLSSSLDVDRPPRSQEDMAKEAFLLRPYFDKP